MRAAVVADEELLVGGAEQAGPVDGVVVAEPAVLGDVDVPGADLVQGLELQGRDALLLQHQQGDAAGEKGPHGRVRGRGVWRLYQKSFQSFESLEFCSNMKMLNGS